MAGDSRTIRNENGQFSRSHERTFTTSGTYTVKANGARVKTTNACGEASSAMVTVAAGAPQATAGTVAELHAP